MKKIIFSFIIMFIFLLNINAASTEYNYNEYLDNSFSAKFYNKLVTPSDYLETEITKKVDLLSKIEYDFIGKTSYLNNGFKILTKTLNETNNKVYYIDEHGNSESVLGFTEKSYLKAVMYVKPSTKIIGYGTKSRPYKFVSSSDINITKIFIDNVETTTLPNESGYSMSSKCTGGNATWDSQTQDLNILIDNSPVECQLWFYKNN